MQRRSNKDVDPHSSELVSTWIRNDCRKLEIISPPVRLVNRIWGGNVVIYELCWADSFCISFCQRCLQSYPPDITYKVDKGVLLSFYLPVFHFVVKPLLSFTLAWASHRPNGDVLLFSSWIDWIAGMAKLPALDIWGTTGNSKLWLLMNICQQT